MFLVKLTDRDKDGPVDFLSKDSDCIEAYHVILSEIWFIQGSAEKPDDF